MRAMWQVHGRLKPVDHSRDSNPVTTDGLHLWLLVEAKSGHIGIRSQVDALWTSVVRIKLID